MDHILGQDEQENVVDDNEGQGSSLYMPAETKASEEHHKAGQKKKGFVSFI